MNYVLQGYLEKRAFWGELKETAQRFAPEPGVWESITKYWKGLKPRTQHAIIGAGLGTIPGSIYGWATARPGERKFSRALKYGRLGALGGAGLGYISPLMSAEDVLVQRAKMDPYKARQIYADPELRETLRIYNLGDPARVAQRLQELPESERLARQLPTVYAQALELGRQKQNLWERIKFGYGDIFGLPGYERPMQMVEQLGSKILKRPIEEKYLMTPKDIMHRQGILGYLSNYNPEYLEAIKKVGIRI